MSAQNASGNKLSTAAAALVGALAGVQPLVPLQITGLPKPFAAVEALERTLVSVEPLVGGQITGLRKSRGAHAALERPLASVGAAVRF